MTGREFKQLAANIPDNAQVYYSSNNEEHATEFGLGIHTQDVNAKHIAVLEFSFWHAAAPYIWVQTPLGPRYTEAT